MGRKARLRRGFTLVEMLLVMAIFSLLSAMAVANLTPLTLAARNHGRAEQLAGFLAHVRGRAVAEGRCYRARIDATSSRVVAERRTSGDCVTLSKTSEWEHVEVAAGVSIGGVEVQALTRPTLTPESPTESDKLAVVFRPNGRLYGDGDRDVADDMARFKLVLPVTATSSLDQDRRTVVVTAVGRVCVKKHFGVFPGLSTSTTCP